jgi:nicotinate-nucleotide pyrophosphorylase
VLAGVPFFTEVFAALDCRVEWLLAEGDLVDPATSPEGKVVVAKVSGKCRHILLGERTALNILTRASGIATEAKRSVEIARALGWHGHVAGTRKTTPGFRLVEKYALLVAGAATHRHDLSQMVMLKDNHVWAAGSITNAVHKAKRATGFSMKIEVEARKLEEAVEAVRHGSGSGVDGERVSHGSWWCSVVRRRPGRTLSCWTISRPSSSRRRRRCSSSSFRTCSLKRAAASRPTRSRSTCRPTSTL